MTTLDSNSVLSKLQSTERNQNGNALTTAALLEYDAYRTKYSREHPASVPRKPHVALTPRWLKLVILFVFFAAAMVSGAHTVTAVARTIGVKEGTLISLEWHRQIISLLGFAMVELVMFVSAYMLILHPENKRLLYALLFISLSVAIAGNLDSTFEALSTAANMNALTVFVGLAVGIGAPLTTLLTGELFSRIKVQDDRLTTEAWKLFREDMKQFDANVLSAYRKYEREQNERIEAETARRLDSEKHARLMAENVLSEQTQTRTDNRQTTRAGFGHNRTSDGQQRVVRHFTDNPADARLPLRQLAEIIGVNKDTVNAGRKLWQNATDEDTAETPALGSAS